MKTKLYCLFITLTLLAGTHQAAAQNWDNWHPLGNNVSVSFAQVPGSTYWTWKFQNNGTATITYMDFYITDSTGQHTDVLPGNLAPSAIIGGWAAFTAVSPPTILIKTIQWANSSSDSSATGATVTSQQLQQQQSAQQALQQIQQQQQQAQQNQQQQQALIEQQRTAQQARDQQIVNNAYAGVAANNNAAQAVNNAVGTIANVLEQREQEKEQLAENEAQQQADAASRSGNFVDKVKAWRANPDYQQFLSDYAAANNGAGFTADPDQLTDASVDFAVHNQIQKDLIHEQSQFDDWKLQPISIAACQTYGSNLSMDEVISQINTILTVHTYVDKTADPTEVQQINTIDDTGICITTTGQHISPAGRYSKTVSYAWSNVDITQARIPLGNAFFEVIFRVKEGYAYGKYSYRGDDMDAQPVCQFSGNPQLGVGKGTLTTGFDLDSKVAAEHLVGLVARAAQLASIPPSGIGVSASPTLSQTDNSKTQPALATPQPPQSTPPTANEQPIDALNERLHDCTVGMWSPGDSYSYWPGAFKATLVDNKIEFLAEGHFSNARATPYRYAITVALSDLTPDSVSVLTDKENKWTTTLLIGNTQSGRAVHLQQGFPVWLATNKQGQYVSITIQDNSKIKPMYDFLKATLSQLIQQSQGLGAGIAPQPAAPQTDNSQPQPAAATANQGNNQPVVYSDALVAKANAGDATAQFNLAECYRIGRGVEQDLIKAKEWYQLSAAQGNLQAQTWLDALTKLLDAAKAARDAIDK